MANNEICKDNGRFYSILNNLFDTDEKQDNDSIIMTKRFSSRKKEEHQLNLQFSISMYINSKLDVL